MLGVWHRRVGDFLQRIPWRRLGPSITATGRVSFLASVPTSSRKCGGAWFAHQNPTHGQAERCDQNSIANPAADTPPPHRIVRHRSELSVLPEGWERNSGLRRRSHCNSSARKCATGLISSELPMFPHAGIANTGAPFCAAIQCCKSLTFPCSKLLSCVPGQGDDTAYRRKKENYAPFA